MTLLSKFGDRIRHWKGKSNEPAPATGESQSSGAHTIPENRQLGSEERALIEWLVANGDTAARAYADQLKAVRVVGRCSCGCPTVNLAVGDDQKATTGPSVILADFLGVTRDGVEVGVILHAREGKLSELEIYSLGTDAKALPRIESLRDFGP